MPIRKLPEAPQAVHIIGPAMILVALGVGFGETYLWPRLVIVFGPDIRWLFMVGVLVQAVVMLEMARYAMATGESIFFGAARVFKPLMWFFFVVAILVYIWPGHISGGADALEELTGIPWQVSATVGLLVIGVMFTVVTVIYNLIEGLLAFLVGVLVIGSAIVGAIVGSLDDLGDDPGGHGPLRHGHPARGVHGRVVPGRGRLARVRRTVRHAADVVHAVAARQGRGHGRAHPEGARPAARRRGRDDPRQRVDVRHRRPRGAAQVAGLAQVGHASTRCLLFFGITMLVTIIFTVMAMNAAELNPGRARGAARG